MNRERADLSRVGGTSVGFGALNETRPRVLEDSRPWVYRGSRIVDDATPSLGGGCSDLLQGELELHDLNLVALGPGDLELKLALGRQPLHARRNVVK